MGAHAPERSHTHSGRIANRREQLRCLLCLLFLLTILGCRSTGTRADSTSGVLEDSPTRRNTLLVPDADDEHTRAVAATKPRSHEPVKRTLREPHRMRQIASKSDDDSADDEAPAVRTNRSRFINKVAQSGFDANSASDEPDLTDSMIKILSFNDQAETDEQPSRRKTKSPKKLPKSSDDSGKSLRLSFPKELPGASTPGFEMPEADDDDPEQISEKLAAIDVLFPPPPVPRRLVIPADRSMTLEELEELALQNNPTLYQAIAAVMMAQGTTIQAGLSPNPNIGYESDTVGSSFTRDYQGVFASQLFKTAGKLGLQRAVANLDSMNSQLYYERTKIDVLHEVRQGYFNVLVAQESMKINEALLRFSNQVYEIMVDRLKEGEQARYEVHQLNTLVDQANAAYVASQNSYLTYWKQLAAATGTPELPIANLAGRVDMPVPNLNQDALLDWILSVHPDLHASRNMKKQSELNLDLQRRLVVPDVTIAGAFQNDSTTPGFGRTSYNLNVSAPVPLFDRNQGNIRNAQGKLAMTSQQYAVTKNSLTSQLADAFGRYQTGRVNSEFYRTRILPNAAKAYRGVYERHIDDSDKVAFGDIIVAQQNLAAFVSSYIVFLQQQWAAAVDISNLIQLRNFRELFPERDVDPQIPAPSPANREGAQP